MGKTVTVLLLSDVHGRVSVLKNLVKSGSYDLALVAGDVSNYAGGAYREVLEVLSQNLPLSIVVPGNVDPPDIAKLNLKNVLVIHKQIVEASGLYVAGVGGGIGFSFWKIPYLTDVQIGEFIRGIEEALRSRSAALHVLLTHTPPEGSGLDRVYSGEYVGSRKIREFIETYEPVLHLCGHIHEGRGIVRIGRTVAVNPGPSMAGYYGVARFSGSRLEVEVELKRVGS
ncbi:MAG: metallophosphoesterase [Sulfolobales archaeon]|nr:metallophosphoesterase [Sulfolobales archaeon]MCX8208540.1 metallophosphoesterase [Sulfolobales archaeon]MDW8010383.1 metallophosphoesterase [Sulfolobales archaeon]